VLQQDFGKRAEMTLRISIADAEVGLGLHTEHVGEEIVGAEQYVFFEAFDIDLEEVGLGNQPFGKKECRDDGPAPSGFVRPPARRNDWFLARTSSWRWDLPD